MVNIGVLLRAPESMGLTHEPSNMNLASMPSFSSTRSPSCMSVLTYRPPDLETLKAASNSVRSFFHRPSANALGKRPARSALELFPAEATRTCPAGGVTQSNEARRPPLSTISTAPPASLVYVRQPASSPSTSGTESGSLESSEANSSSTRQTDSTIYSSSEEHACATFVVPHPHRNSASLSYLSYLPERPGFSIRPTTGPGMTAAQRTGSSFANGLNVKSCRLTDEFTTASTFPGFRTREIGKGSTSVVRIVYRKEQDKNIAYAAKEFRKQSPSENVNEYERKVKSEFSIASSLAHPNIVGTVRLCTHNGRWYHVMEYCSRGELFSLMRMNYLRMQDNMCLFKQLLQGVAYLHKNGIAHRDIKLDNLLLSEKGHLKITDFGVSEVFMGPHPGYGYGRTKYWHCLLNEISEVRRCAPGICGSRPYIAPEVLARDCIYSYSTCRCWSC